MSEVARMCLVATVLSSLNGEVTNVLLALFQGCLSHTLGLRTLTIIMSRKKTFAFSMEALFLVLNNGTPPTVLKIFRSSVKKLQPLSFCLFSGFRDMFAIPKSSNLLTLLYILFFFLKYSYFFIIKPVYGFARLRDNCLVTVYDNMTIF